MTSPISNRPRSGASSNGLRIGMLSFGAPPGKGGGAVYVAHMAEEVGSSSAISEFHIFTEQYELPVPDPLKSLEGVSVYRPFTFRAGRKSVGQIQRRTLYVQQQLGFISMARDILRLKLDALLIHSGVLRHPSLIRFVLAAAKRAGTLTIMDSRDTSLGPEHKAAVLRFDANFACGEAPAERIAEITGGVRPVPIVPIPFRGADLDEIDPQETAAVLRELGIAPDQRFVMMTGGLTWFKGAERAAHTALELNKGDDPLPVVSCGVRRSYEPVVDKALATGAIRHIGGVSRTAFLGLLSQASCVASFSVSEGLPRTILECLAMDRPVFPPSCVPEFRALQSLDDSAPNNARLIREMCASDATVDHSTLYDLSQHEPARVVERLAAELSALLGAR